MSSVRRVAARIRQERLRLGWTQIETAARAGLPLSTYKRFERLGVISLGGLADIATAMGLEISLATSASAAAPVIDPRVSRIRQRGLRRPRSAAEPILDAGTAAAAGSRPRQTKGRPPATLPSTDTQGPAPAQVSAVLKRYRQAINHLVNTIVSNRLNNYTAATPVQNVMRSNRVPAEERAAFVAAVEGSLGALNAENGVALRLSAATYEAWAKGWKFDLGIVGALE